MVAKKCLSEDDIPGASLSGRNPAVLKTEELRFLTLLLHFQEVDEDTELRDDVCVSINVLVSKSNTN